MIFFDDSNWLEELTEWREGGGELSLKVARNNRRLKLRKLKFESANNYIDLFLSRENRVRSFLRVIDFDARNPNGVDADNLPDDYPYRDVLEINGFFTWYCLKTEFCDRYESTSLLLSRAIFSLITEYENDPPSGMLIKRVLNELDDYYYIDFK